MIHFSWYHLTGTENWTVTLCSWVLILIRIRSKALFIFFLVSPELIRGYYYLRPRVYLPGKSLPTRRCIDQCTGASSTTWAEQLSRNGSRTLRWQLSTTSLRPTLSLKGSTKCSMRWASTLGNLANCITIIWPIQTTFMTTITHVSFTALLLNALSSSSYSLHSGNICCMLQQRNSMTLRNVHTQRWNQVTCGGMNRYISWISSELQWF